MQYVFTIFIKGVGYVLYGDLDKIFVKIYIFIYLIFTGQGLRIKTACTQTSDTVCEPLEGFYCSDGYRGGCRYAVEHRKCSPGQYVKQKGNSFLLIAFLYHKPSQLHFSIFKSLVCIIYC